VLLPINFAHIVKNFELDFYHRDPFDRIIIAQAMVEEMSIISKDTSFKQYNIKQIW